MARRKNKKQTPENTARLTRLLPHLVIFSVLVLGIVAVWKWGGPELFKSENMPLNSIKIESGFKHVSAAEVRQLVTPYINDGFLDVDVQGIQQVLQAMPWIKTASVRLIWPDVLHVSLVEQKAYARWGEKGLISLEGGIFYPAPSTIPAGLPVLSGPERSSALVLASYHEMSQLLNGLELKIDQLTLDDRRAWQVALNNGARLLLGRSENKNRLEKFMRYYPKELVSKNRVIDEVDLRYTNGFAVRWKKLETTQDANIS